MISLIKYSLISRGYVGFRLLLTRSTRLEAISASICEGQTRSLLLLDDVDTGADVTGQVA